MKTTVKQELAQYLIVLITDRVLTNENRQEWHFHAFNEDYYLIGYYQCAQWLKHHEIGELEGAGTCTEYEQDNFGEVRTTYDNTEKVVNMLAYIWGEELLNEIGADDVEELREGLNEILS